MKLLPLAPKFSLLIRYILSQFSTLHLALDYVSDYQLKSAFKDAICIAPSKVTQMIFAVLED